MFVLSPLHGVQGFPSVSDLPHHWGSRRQARTGGPLLSRGFAGEPAASSSTEQLENSEEEAQPSPSDQEREAPGGDELDSPSSYPKPAPTTPGTVQTQMMRQQITALQTQSQNS